MYSNSNYILKCMLCACTCDRNRATAGPRCRGARSCPDRATTSRQEVRRARRVVTSRARRWLMLAGCAPRRCFGTTRRRRPTVQWHVCVATSARPLLCRRLRALAPARCARLSLLGLPQPLPVQPLRQAIRRERWAVWIWYYASIDSTYIPNTVYDISHTVFVLQFTYLLSDEYCAVFFSTSMNTVPEYASWFELLCIRNQQKKKKRSPEKIRRKREKIRRKRRAAYLIVLPNSLQRGLLHWTWRRYHIDTLILHNFTLYTYNPMDKVPCKCRVNFVNIHGIYTKIFPWGNN